MDQKKTITLFLILKKKTFNYKVTSSRLAALTHQRWTLEEFQ
ncbi:hypothetical protein [Mycoplasmopsis fermentans]|nr:hypothetical protein [Mycoplasmopsis fermentans]